MSNAPSASFAVNIEGNFQQEAGADADAALKLADALDDDLAALRAMQGALRNLTSANMGATKEAKAFKEQIAAQKAVVGAQQLAMLKQGVSVAELAKKRKAAADALKRQQSEQAAALQRQVSQIAAANRTSLGQITAALQGSSGAMGAMLGRTSQLAATLGKGGLAGAAALAVVAVVAVTASITLATLALAKYALGVLDARRAEMIRLEGLTKLPNWFGIAAGKATDLQAAIDRVSSRVALGRDKIYSFAESLYKAGLRGKNLDVTLQATATRASVLGTDMANAYASMAAGAALTGQSVQALAKQTERQFGGLARQQMLSFAVQIEKARENLDAMFRDVKIDGFLEKFATLTEMMSQSSATGRALKVMLEALLNPLFGSANEGAPAIKRLFQGMVIGALYATLAIVKLRNWFREAFGGIRTGVNWANVAVYTGIGLFGTLALTLVALTATVTALGAAFALAFGATVLTFGVPFLALGAAIIGVVYAFKWLWDAGRRALNYLKSLNWGDIGQSILDGITRPLGKLWESGKAFGKQMLEGFKAAWEIRSPSRVADRLVSRDIAGGSIRGAQRAGGRVGIAIGGMLAPRDDSGRRFDRGYSPPPGGGGAMARGGRPHVTIEELHVHTSSDDPKQAAREIYDELCQLVEGTVLEMGGAF